MTMRIAALGLIVLIALLHSYIAWFEIFAWETRGPVVFSAFPPDLFPDTVAMAANQGIYNAFLAAGLFWSLLIKDRSWQVNVATFFLLCIAVAGVFGAYTVTMRTLMIQTVPAVIALGLLWQSRPKS
jgi:putative membrane protein